MNVMREVHITPVLNGFIVNVGCQRLVYSDIEVLASDLVRYQRHPEEIEKSYIAKAVNKTIGPFTEPVPAPADEPRMTAGEARHNGYGVNEAPTMGRGY